MVLKRERILEDGAGKIKTNLGHLNDGSKERVNGLRAAVKLMVSAGWRHTVGLKRDGTVVAVGYNEDRQCDYEKKITRLEELERELSSLMQTMDSLGVSFERDVSFIRSMLKNPLKLDDAEKAVSMLKENLQTLQDFKLLIEAWRKEGYDVEELERILETEDMDLIRSVFKECEQTIQAIEEVEKRQTCSELGTLKRKSFA